MHRASPTKTLLRSLLICFVVLSLVVPSESFAIYNGVRTPVSFDQTKNMCTVGPLSFDPLSANNDIDFEISNPVCATYIAASGAALVAAEIAAFVACKFFAIQNPMNLVAEQGTAASEVPTPPFPTPALPARIAAKVSKCGVRIATLSVESGICSGSLGTACAGVALASADLGICCGAITAYAVAVGAAVAALAIIWDTARITFENGRVCGHDWKKWTHPKLPNGTDDTSKWIKTKGPYNLCLDKLFLDSSIAETSTACQTGCVTAGCSTIDIKNKPYREFIYGGKEYEDKGDNSCDNPTTWNTAAARDSSGQPQTRAEKILGYNGTKQRYYMTGPGNAPAYACHRFRARATSEADRTAMQVAYDCCKRRSQNAMCIENRAGSGVILGDYSYAFCEIGSRCAVSTVFFDVYASTTQANYACAKTYSVCPYNHLLGGGTEQKTYSTTDPTQVVNFCQFMNHCSKIPVLPYVRTVSFEGGFVSQACRDMKGDSQNVYGYTSELVPINVRGFSAPMIQCFKETMENVFLNKAGYTQCVNPDENPSNDGTCVSGYIYRSGYDLPGKSFFLKIQDNLRSIIKLILTLSIVGFGIATLLAVPGAYIKKKVLLTYVVKIGLVMFFAVGDGWQMGFMKSVLNTSVFMADFMFRADESLPTNQLDGCQFPRYNFADSDETTKYNNPAYPPGKSYLRVWDILDCKIARALGFGPEVSVPNLVLMILGGFFTGGLGIVFFVAAFVFAFFLITLTLRALHIFLMSMTSVIILMYVSPITISLSLFERTKGIFNGWWKQMLGFTLQPMILFAYLGILITLFDQVIIGKDITFTPQTITDANGNTITDTYGRRVPKTITCNETANNTSIYCIFRIAQIQTYTGFEVLGIGLPVLFTMNQTKLESIMKAALLMFIFTKFMDQITMFAAKLVGGAELKSDWGGVATMASKSYGALRAIQERAINASKKHAGTVARKGVDAFKNKTREVGDKGKSIKDADGSKKGGDQTESSGLAKDGDITVNDKKQDSQQKGGGGDAPSNGNKADGGGGGGAPDGGSNPPPTPPAPPASTDGDATANTPPPPAPPSPPSGDEKPKDDEALRGGGTNTGDGGASSAQAGGATAAAGGDAPNAGSGGAGGGGGATPPAARSSATRSQRPAVKSRLYDQTASSRAKADGNAPVGGGLEAGSGSGGGGGRKMEVRAKKERDADRNVGPKVDSNNSPRRPS